MSVADAGPDATRAARSASVVSFFTFVPCSVFLPRPAVVRSLPKRSKQHVYQVGVLSSKHQVTRGAISLLRRAVKALDVMAFTYSTQRKGSSSAHLGALQDFGRVSADEGHTGPRASEVARDYVPVARFVNSFDSGFLATSDRVCAASSS